MVENAYLDRKDALAYSILNRFDQVKEEIERGGENLDTFTWADFIPPTLRQILKEYNANNTTKEYTLQKIIDTRHIADTYLKQHGCNADNLFEQDRLRLETQKKESKIHKEKNQKLEYLSKKMEEIHSLLLTGKREDINKALELMEEIKGFSLKVKQENNKEKKQY